MELYQLKRKKPKDFEERLIELVKTDKELHDATVRLINALVEMTEINNAYRKKRLENKKHSKRLLTNDPYKPILRNADPIQEGTNFDIMRAYGAKTIFGYAVIIADDNLFEGV